MQILYFREGNPGSSNGRTAPFGGAYRGSSPRPGALSEQQIIQPHSSREIKFGGSLDLTCGCNFYR